MVVKTVVAVEAREESRCHLHRKSFSFEDPQVRLFNFGLKTQFHSIPCRVQGRSCLLEAVFGTYCLFVFNIHKPSFLLLAEKIPAQEWY